MRIDEKVLKYVIENMTPKQIQDIFEVNKLKLKGFRINGKITKKKKNRMISDLKERKNLEELLKYTTKYYIDNQKLDYIWAIPTGINENEIEKRAYNNSDSTIFELFAAEKYEIIRNLMEKDYNFSNSVIENIDEERTNTQNFVSEKNHNLKDIRKYENDLGKLKIEYNHKMELLNKQKEVIEQFENEKRDLNDRILFLENKIKKQNEIISEVQQQKIAIIGGETYENHLIHHLPTYSFINYAYYNEYDFYYIKEEQKFDTIWIMRFSLSRKEYDELKQTNLFKRYRNIQKTTIFNTIDSFNIFVEKVKEFYE